MSTGLEGEYTGLAKLATTARGTVLRARRSADGMAVVLKQRSLGSPTLERRELERELQNLRRIDSPLVVRAIEVAEIEWRDALVLAYFDGQSLSVPNAGLEV